MTLRRTPQDFIVEESLREDLRIDPSSGAHAIYQLSKTSLTTPDAISHLARVLKVKPGVIDYAGLKDKHAATMQHVSIPIIGATLPPSADGLGWSLRRIGFLNEALNASAIACNRFTIIVRGLSRGAAKEMGRRAAFLALPRATDRLLIVNYFGDQRFGSARHGQGFAARRLIEGDFEGALKLLIATPARKDSGARRAFTRAAVQGWGDWKGLLKVLPRMPERAAVEALDEGKSFKEAFAALPNTLQVLCVEAYQSHVWNSVARRLMEPCGGGAMRADDEFGEMVFPAAGAVPAVLSKLELPMPSASCEPCAPWGGALRDVLAEEGIGLAQLVVPGLRRPVFGDATRPLFVEAAGFLMSELERDEMAAPRSPNNAKLTVRFELPRGAYATVALRALGQ